MIFDVQGRQTKQALYICDKVDQVYFSRNACLDAGILPASFPHPMSASELDEVHASFPDVGPVCPSSHMSPVVDRSILSYLTQYHRIVLRAITLQVNPLVPTNRPTLWLRANRSPVPNFPPV